MSGTIVVKLEPEESSVCSVSDDTVTQSFLNENYLPGGCESESKIKCEVEEFTDNKSTACSETSALHSADSSHQLIDSTELRADVKQEFLQDTNSDLSDQSSNEESEAEMDTDSSSVQNSMKRKSNYKVKFRHLEEEQAVNDSDVASRSKSTSHTAVCNRCPICMKVLSSFQKLRQHVQSQHVHEGQQDHTPSAEALSDDSNSELRSPFAAESHDIAGHTQARKSHISAVHVKKKPWKCSQCLAFFSRPCDLNQHIRFVHNNEKLHECSSCDKKFSTFYHRDRHWSSVHAGDKNYSCDQCDYKCSSKCNLARHQKTVHDGVKDYSCEGCEYRSSTKSDLKRHCIAVHYNLKPHKCSECESSFSHKHHLRYHENSVHRKEKPHSCSVCSKSFTTKGDVRRHVDAVHNLTRHQCQLCSKSFSDKYHLSKHVKTSHKEEVYNTVGWE